MVYGEEDRIDILRFAFTEEVPLTRINRISSSLVQLSSPNLLPSGIIRGKKCIIGNGVVLDPWALLKEIKEISIINFDHNDVIRHPLVTKIVEAYQKNTNDKG